LKKIARHLLQLSRILVAGYLVDSVQSAY